MSQPLTTTPDAAAIVPPGHDGHDDRSRLSRLLASGAGRNLGLVIALLVLFAIGAITAGGASPTSTTSSRSCGPPRSSA